MTTLLHRRRWPGRVARRFVAACSLALLPGCAAEPPSPGPVGLAGTWRAEMEHGGETGEIVVRFEEASAGGLSATEEAVYLGAVGVADYLVDHRGALVAVDRTTGRAIWRWGVDRPDSAKVWGVAASPSTGAGRVFAADLAGRVVAFGA